MNTGVYLIINKINYKIYVGSSENDINVRRRSHFGKLKRQVHENKYLQNSYNKYGKHNFIFSFVDRCSKEECLSLEQWWMDILESYNPKYGYNVCKIAGNTTGVKRTEEAKLKISLAHRGRFKGEKSVLFGVPLSQERKDNLSKKQKERFKTQDNPFKGKKHTEETKKILSKLRSGTKWSIESRKKMSNTRKGRKHSPETILSLKNCINSGKFVKGRKVPKEIVNKRINTISKTTYQYDLNWKLIKEWFSAKVAAESLEFNKSSVSSSCRKNKKYKNFKWSYTKNYKE